MEKGKEIHRKPLKDKEAGQRPLKTMKWVDCKMSGEEKNSAREVEGIAVVVRRGHKHQMTTLGLDSGSRLDQPEDLKYGPLGTRGLASSYTHKITQTRWTSSD